MMLRIGQKVTQIKAFQWPTYRGEATPQFGVVYTVRAIKEGAPGEFYLRFFEIRNPEHHYLDEFMEMAFFAGWFRPVVDRPTDISIFEEMLSPAVAPTKEKVAP